MLDNKGFDIWSEEYDKFVKRNSKGYPFEGYYDVLNFVYNLIEKKDSSKVLDIGVGTGMLTKGSFRNLISYKEKLMYCYEYREVI